MPQTLSLFPDLSVSASEMACLVAEYDWAATPLGPIDRWSQALRVAVGICLNSRFPMFVWWGPHLINIYNDAYIPMLGKRHPLALGRPARDIWGEIWPVVGPQADAVMQRGEATWNERVLLVMERNNYTEDTYFTWSYSPIPNGAGGIGGLFCACTEETQRVRAEAERDQLLTQVQSERARLSDVFAQSPAFVAVLRGPDHVFEFVNERYYQLIGRRDLIGRTAREALPEVAGQGYFEVLDRVYATGEPFVGTGRRVLFQRQPDKPLAEVFIDFVYQPMRGHDGAVTGILAHGIDVTARRSATDRIARLYSVAAALSEALTVADVARVAVDQGVAASGAVAGSLSLLSEDGAALEMVGSVGYPAGVMDPWKNIPLDAPIPLTDAVRRCEPVYLTSAEDRLRQYPVLSTVTSDKPTLSSASVPLLVGSKCVGVLALSFDRPESFSPQDREFILSLSRQCAQALERARLYEAELRARAEAERASEAKSEFLATLSHELRTPLTPVLLTVSLMESHPGLPDDLRDDVATIRRNVELESRLISDLLDLTRIAKGKLQLDLQDVDLHLLIRAAADICQREASARLLLDLKASRHTVRGDSTRLQQVFWNLINNAQKFTPPEGSITVRSSDAPGGRVRVEVSDTGVGIDPAVLPRLFSAFEQGDLRASRQHAGLGLGLAITKRLVEAQGGTVAAFSEGRGRGATFTVELPAVLVTTQKPAASKPAPLPQPDAALSVLLVEDHEPTLRVMTRLLSRLGHRVTGATTLASATAAASQSSFDLLLSDLGLPDGSGLDLMRRVRDRYTGRAIAITGYGMESDIAASREAGFTEHVVKPVDLHALQSAISRITASIQP